MNNLMLQVNVKFCQKEHKGMAIHHQLKIIM